MQKEELHKDYGISWQEPPRTTGVFQVTVAGSTQETKAILEAATGSKGAHIIEGSDRDNAISNAKAFIGSLPEAS